MPHLNARARLITQFDPKNPAAEAYRILRTNIQFLSSGDKPIKTILLTSSSMQEGKSTTIGNLATAFAQEGKRVLLVGCNLRRPSLYRVFGLEKGPGMADILIDKARWQDCVRSVSDLSVGEFNIDDILATPGLENLHIITFGQIPPNPSELLSSDKMDKFLAEVRQEYDLVLIDAPPLLPVADSSLIASKVDAVILVYQVGKVPRTSLVRAKERMENVKANVIGIVLNDIRPEVSGSSYVSQYYMHYYGDPTDRSRQKKGPPLVPGAVSGAVALPFLSTMVSLITKFGITKFLVTLSGVVLFFGSVSLGVIDNDANWVLEYLKERERKQQEADQPATIGAKHALQNQEAAPSVPVVAPKAGTGVSPASSAPDTVYTIQLFSNQNSCKTRNLALELNRKGVPAWTDMVVLNNGTTVYRVCAGRFATYEEAERTFKARNLEKRFSDAFFVRVALPVTVPKAHGAAPLPLVRSGAVRESDNRKPERSIYSVQLYSFKDLDAAKSESLILLRRGLPIWIEMVSLSGKGNFYRINTGKFASKNEALLYLARLDSEEFPGALVTCLRLPVH
jgi:capsular exopolysaccharide synthesis family protein